MPLFRRPNSPFWQIRYKRPNGKTVRLSADTTDKRLAQELEAKLTRDAFEEARLGCKPKRTWQEAVVQWAQDTAHKATQDDDLAHLRWARPYLDDLTLDQIDRTRLRHIQTERKASGVSNATVNRTLAVLHAILRRAARVWEWIDTAPTVPALPEPKRRIRWLTPAESERLIAELPEHLADMVRFSLSTGLREANVTGLEWSQVDLARRVAWIHADQAKAREAIGVPLNTDAVLVLRRWIGRHQARVFCYQRHHAAGTAYWSPVTKAGGRAWRKALDRAGIQDFRWHDLRHTWASWHVQAGTPLHVLQELGGWHDGEMVRKYAHLAPEHLAEHAARIEHGIQPARRLEKVK
jgi:integrase